MQSYIKVGKFLRNLEHFLLKQQHYYLPVRDSSDWLMRFGGVLRSPSDCCPLPPPPDKSYEDGLTRGLAPQKDVSIAYPAIFRPLYDLKEEADVILP